MTSIVQKLTKRGLISPPGFLPMNVQYETITGSYSYGVSTDASDMDVYGFCVPPKDMIFPHLKGDIPGFGKQKKRFDQYQQHHIDDRNSGKQYDLSIYSIVRYFHLCMENNPNMLDSLFTARHCVLHSTAVGELVRENRKLFLHKGCWPKFKGYAYSQLHKMDGHNRTGKRKADFEKWGFDRKFAYHVVRLLYEAEMILAEGDLDLMRNREHLKAIRRGDVTGADIRAWAAGKELALEKVYNASKLPWGPDEARIKALLLQCLETHYGSLADAVVAQDLHRQAIREIAEIVDSVRNKV